MVTIGMHCLLVSVVTQPVCQRTQTKLALWFPYGLGGLVCNHSLRVGRTRFQTVAKLVSEHSRDEHDHIVALY
jgi:hypothetical protein